MGKGNRTGNRMKPEQQVVTTKTQSEEDKPNALALSEADISLLIRFFLKLDEWDRQSTVPFSADSMESSRAGQHLAS